MPARAAERPALAALLLLVCAAAVAAQGGAAPATTGTCPLSKDLNSPEAQTLTFCKRYKDSACCSVAEETVLKRKFDDILSSVYGACPGCLANAKSFYCGVVCSPSQADYSEVLTTNTDGSYKTAKFRLCPELCGHWYDSCGNGSRPDAAGGTNQWCSRQLDSNMGITVEINHFDCFVADASNQCSGGYYVQPAKSEVEHPLLVGGVIIVIVVAAAAVVGLVSLFMLKRGVFGRGHADGADGAAAAGRDGRSVGSGSARSSSARSGRGGGGGVPSVSSTGRSSLDEEEADDPTAPLAGAGGRAGRAGAGDEEEALHAGGSGRFYA